MAESESRDETSIESSVVGKVSCPSGNSEGGSMNYQSNYQATTPREAISDLVNFGEHSPSNHTACQGEYKRNYQQ